MKAFIFINSLSGRGYGEQYYKNYLCDFINNNFTEYKVINIPSDDNNNYYISNEDNNENNTIFIVGGDGTISLSIENILKHSNFNELKIPIYICPFGSGNGLAKNLNINPYDLRLDGNKKYIYPIQITNNKKLSFLSQTWGIISDIDINTEFLRKIGDFRFYYGILKSTLFPKYYNGKCQITTNNNKIDIDGEFLLFCGINGQWLSKDFKLVSVSNIFDDYINIIIIRKKISLYDRIKLIYNLAFGKIEDLDFVEYYRAYEYNLEMIDKSSVIVIDGEVINDTYINVNRDTENKFLFYYF